MPLTTSFKNTLLNAICGKSSFTNSIYAALSSTDPSSSVTEPDATLHPSYARAAVCVYGGQKNYMNNASGGSVSNAETIYFPEALTAWGTFGYVALYTAATGGTLIGYAHIVNDSDEEISLQIAANTVPLIRAGKFTLSFVEPSEN